MLPVRVGAHLSRPASSTAKSFALRLAGLSPHGAAVASVGSPALRAGPRCFRCGAWLCVPGQWTGAMNVAYPFQSLTEFAEAELPVTAATFPASAPVNVADSKLPVLACDQ